MRASDRKLIELDLKDRLKKLEEFAMMHPAEAFGEMVEVIKLIVKLTITNGR